jgi:hypothetical protein
MKQQSKALTIFDNEEDTKRKKDILSQISKKKGEPKSKLLS